MKYLFIIVILLIPGCLCNDSQEWLLIEHPNPRDSTVMRFPGWHADTLEECQQQSAYITSTWLDSQQGIMMCGYKCMFSVGSVSCEYTEVVYSSPGLCAMGQ